MYIKAEGLDGTQQYLNSSHYTRFTVDTNQVEAWTPDNLTVPLKKTKELKDQLDRLAKHSDAAFKKFD